MSSIFNNIDSQTSKHSLALPPSRYRYERYSAAERLLGEYLRAAMSN